MIDREARDILAESFRHLVAGQISNDQFEDRLRRSRDPGVNEVYFCGAWPLYDDLHEHKLTGKWAIKPEHKPIAARYLLFLKTNLEYEWPRRTGTRQLLAGLLSLLTLGLFGRVFNRIRDKRSGGDQHVWPFFRQGDYEMALRQHPYLSKEGSTEPPPSGYSPAGAAGSSLRRNVGTRNQRGENGMPGTRQAGDQKAGTESRADRK